MLDHSTILLYGTVYYNAQGGSMFYSVDITLLYEHLHESFWAVF